VVSKYLKGDREEPEPCVRRGETEQRHSLLDEADAWLRKGTQVKSSHDRYTNMEIKYLFQKIEEYE